MMSDIPHKPDCICVTCEDSRNATVTVDRQEWERMKADADKWMSHLERMSSQTTITHFNTNYKGAFDVYKHP